MKTTQQQLNKLTNRIHEIVEDLGELSMIEDGIDILSPTALLLNDALTHLEKAYSLLAIGKE